MLNAISTAFADEFAHGRWDQLLKAHVEELHERHATAVDYDGMARDRELLKTYLNALSQVSRHSFDRWPRDDRLAFLINAYNAWTVELVLTGWPGLASIKELGSLFRSPWSKPFIPLLGETRSLDDIEHGLIRKSGDYNEPRIHFAVNCASVGCPALRREAYSGDRIDAQLQDQVERFLGDRSRARLDRDTLRVSPLFTWYREDFEQGWLGYSSVAEFLGHYAGALELSPRQVAALRSGEIRIAYFAYDWRLNATRPADEVDHDPF